VIEVLFAEDQTIVRRGIVGLLHLTDDIRVVAEAADGQEALDRYREIQPDVLVLDIKMPKLTGVEVIEELAKDGLVPPAILLTTFDDDELFLQAVRAGARGFLLKDVSVDRFADAIRRVAAGETLLQPAVTERVMRIVQRKGTSFQTSDVPEHLTPRETQVLRLIAGGYSNREIANTLSMSEGSAKNHTSSILSKLGARDRTRAALRAIELGYL